MLEEVEKVLKKEFLEDSKNLHREEDKEPRDKRLVFRNTFQSLTVYPDENQNADANQDGDNLALPKYHPSGPSSACLRSLLPIFSDPIPANIYFGLQYL